MISKPGKHHTLGLEEQEDEAPQLMDVIHDDSVDDFLAAGTHISSTTMPI